MTVTSQLSKILIRSFDEAKLSHHEFLTPEHVLLSALEFPQVCDLLNICGADLETVRSYLNDYLQKQVPVKSVDKEENAEKDSDLPIETHSYKEIMNRAVYHCVSSEKSSVDITDILVSMLDETKNYCSYALRMGGVDRLHLLEAISFVNTSSAETDSDENQTVDHFNSFNFKTVKSGEDSKQSSFKKSILDKFTKNLTKLASQGELGDLIGREDELNRTIQILCRKVKNNPLHVGDAGVGKTVLTEGLAKRIVEGKVPEKLKNAEIFSLNMSSLIAGTKFRGDFEDRIHKITDELLVRKNAILFIDEIHSIVGAGATNGGSMDVANLLKPIFSSGKIRCIGSTTFEEYKKSFEKDRALLRRFQKIDILEPSKEQAVEILKGLRSSYESFHNVHYSDKALVEAVELSIQYLPDRRLPDKAIDIIDEVGSYASIHCFGGFYGKNSAKSDKKAQVTTTIIKQITAKMARVPIENVAGDEKEKLRLLETTLKQEVFGQDEAVSIICKAVKRARAGFRNSERPEGSFLFVGPTGVGKTELARQISKTLGNKLLRYDMSEYQEKHTVSRLIGAPPGYVGFEEGGLLTDAVRKEPNSVILLDEIEKAHEDIYNVLLQVMDYGTLTDNQGRQADFRNCILILTSNAGAKEMAKLGIGFGSENIEDTDSSLKEAVEKEFSPEFRNRLDAIVPFKHLSKQVVYSIVKKEIEKLSQRLIAKKVRLSATEACISYLAEVGYSREFGARNISRIIDEKISSQLVDEVLFGKLSDGGVVVADVKDGENPKVEFSYGR